MDNNSVLANKLVGKIPEDWSYINFKDVYGKPIRDFGSFSTTKLITFLSDGVPFLKSEMINEGSIDWTNTYYISEEVHKLLNKSYVEKDTILFSKIGSALGKAVVYTGEKGICNSNAAIAKIILNEQIADKYYYTYILNNSLAKKQFLRLIVSLLPRINLGDISDLVLPLPPLPEQQKIAKILSTWDKAISTTERLIENSTQQKKALMQQLLIGKKRLLDGLGQRFEGEWEEVSIGSTSKCFSGGTPSRTKDEYYNGSIPWITSGKLNDRFVDSVNEYITELGLQNSSAKIVKNGSILVAMYGATAGKVALNTLDSATVNQAVLALEPKEKFHNLFLFYLLEVEMLKALLLVQGGQPNLSATIIKAIKIKVPALLEQQKIATVLTNADKEIELLEQQLADLQQEKKALMQVLLTGKVRVRVDRSI